MKPFNHLPEYKQKALIELYGEYVKDMFFHIDGANVQMLSLVKSLTMYELNIDDLDIDDKLELGLDDNEDHDDKTFIEVINQLTNTYTLIQIK
jgi:hypothetical protein